jgi:trehalose 6-phosphate synthase/phosphatase
MSDPTRLLVVSNRLPVQAVQESGQWKTAPSAGGLATAMHPILKQAGGLWIGWAGADWSGAEDLERAAQARELLRREQSAVVVDLSAELIHKYYDGYANQALWPLFHGFAARLQFSGEEWDAYREANRRFCEAVVKEYRERDRIWIHDYHLMLLPEMLREVLPEAAIGFFLHIPFPASDIFSLLPRGEELLNGLLGADFIAFHTHQHLQHFRQAVRREIALESTVDALEVPGRTVRLQALPIGIATEEFLRCREAPDTREHLAHLEQRYYGQKVIAAVDRLDYTKGLPERLRTFRRLLKETPELLGKVVLLQVAVPSRENIASYQALRETVHELVSSINGEFGTAEWTPVVYIHRGIPRPELVALYERAEVAWVGPLRDGMNLVAKEYVACHPDGRGVLVLSTFAGSAAEMGEALLINPYDQERTLLTIRQALTMSASEQGERMRALHERVLRNNVFAWSDQFLESLEAAVQQRRDWAPESPPDLPVNELQTAYRKAGKRLLLLDYDGTLVPFAARPQDARPSENLRRSLAELAGDEKNCVIAISGRRRVDLENWLGGVPRLGLAPEHGAVWRLPSSSEWQGREPDGEWKVSVRPILQHYVDRTPGSLIEEKEFALVWHYRLAEAEFGEWLAGELVALLDGMLAETELRAYRGKKIVEVKPLWANKGAFAREVARGYKRGGLILACGDDRTDEDMFESLPDNAWTVHVGGGTSKARYRLPHSGAVGRLLRHLAENSS